MNAQQWQALAETAMRVAVMLAASVALWAGCIWACAALIRWLF